MYESHFGLTEKPFTLTPNPRFLYLSRTHQEALAHLRYGLENRVGFIAVTGEVGTGKTTTLRLLFDQLDETRFRLAMIFNPCLSAMELLRNVNREFGLLARKRSNLSLVEELNDFLLAENRAGRIPVLVIDEAQNLKADVLEQIRLLSNLETDSDKLIQIVLVGQPELAALLERPELRQLAQRISVRCRLDPLDHQEACGYIRHRLQIAGVFGDLFDAKAMAAAFRWSGGVPRLINVLCDRALLCAYAAGQYRVTAAEVRQAAAELDHAKRKSAWLQETLSSLKRAFASERFYWCFGTAIVLEIIVLIWLVGVLV
ncbi:MAG: AAA family ATPase [Desulfuromonadales bacterium]|nr:AAA family ATPase [Desulfuromonadales bacterium]